MWKYSKSTNHQPGFTLVELAIVLVIIGLILAAVLKGQQMIENGKVKNVINDLKGVSTAYYAYMDRYKAIPGDDAAAINHVSGGVNGDGDGYISGRFAAVAAPGPTAESNAFWLDTRLAGFLTGSGSNPPTNSVGGILGIEGSAADAGTTTYSMNGPVVCASNIPWKIAQAVDIQLDDGISTTGTVRTGAASTPATVATVPTIVYGTGASGVPATSTIEEGVHTVCMKI
jgi:prepilin-type N-terminal cleavage/methylation domain-containing protein